VQLRSLTDAERYLDSFLNLERRATFDYERLGLARVRALLQAAGHPERGLPCIHIAGSKGKGSVARMAEALLVAAGRRVGTFTSPHLESWRERFRVDGEEVSVDALLSALRALVPGAERLRGDPELRPSFFDVTTVLALSIFRAAKVDAAVVEVGLGGRLDSTNSVEPRVSVLTTIQLEHTDKLGNTLEAIAREKAGILRPGVPAIHGPLAPEALAAVMASAVAQDAPLEEVGAQLLDESPAGMRLRLADGREVALPVIGRPQAVNAALAVRAVEHFLGRALSRAELAALERVRLPARVERIGDAILDSAHTPDSARALCETLRAIWPGRGWVVVAAISRDKDCAGIFQELAPLARACVITRSEPTRGADPETLAPLAWASGIEPVETEADPLRAVARARALARAGEGLLITGSLYLAGAVRSSLLGAWP
jgi:dihydrofolate synthase/folylpolyglutamate synthase